MALSEQFFTGTDGTALTAANSGYTLVNPSGGAGFTFETSVTNPLSGGSVGKITAAAGTAAEGRFTHPDSTSLAQQLVMRVPPPPTAASCDFEQSRGTRQNSGLRYHTDGSLRVLGIGTEIGGAATWADWDLLVGEDVVVDRLTQEGTTASNGRIRARVRLLSDLATVLWEYDSGTTRDAGVIGTDVINSARAWKITAASAFASDWILFAHRSQEGVSAYLSDPTPAASPPIVVVTGDDTLYVRRDFTGSTPVEPDTSVSHAAVRLSGPDAGTIRETADGLFYLPAPTSGATVYRETTTASPSGLTTTTDITVSAPGGVATGVIRKTYDGTSLRG